MKFHLTLYLLKLAKQWLEELNSSCDSTRLEKISGDSDLTKMTQAHCCILDTPGRLKYYFDCVSILCVCLFILS